MKGWKEFHTSVTEGSRCDVLMRCLTCRYRCWMETRGHGGIFERCASSVLQCWWMCHRRMKKSFPSSHPSPVWFSPRSLRPPTWSTKIDRGLSWCVSTWQPPVSINGPLHTCHNLLKQNCLYFLTQVLSWLSSAIELYFTAGHVCLTFSILASLTKSWYLKRDVPVEFEDDFVFVFFWLLEHQEGPLVSLYWRQGS